MRRVALGCGLFMLFATPAAAEQPASGNGWQQVYLNDFKGEVFVGTSKHRYCVEQAYSKAHEIKEQGGSYRPILALQEAVQIAATTYDNQQVLIVCSPNGALLMYFKSPASLQTVFEAAEQLGTPQKAGSPGVIETRTDIDLKSGKAVSTTKMPPE